MCEQIDAHYDLVLKHIPLYSKRRNSNKQRVVGEIDVIAFKDDYYDLFEVKCSYRVVKAKKQLIRLRRSLHIDKKLRNAFFFCGESGQLETIK